MSSPFETLQERYREIVAQSFAGAADEGVIESIHGFLHDARLAGAVVADPEERSLLRSYVRFLATLLCEAGREIPPVDLLPPDRARWPAAALLGRPRPGAPAWVWGLTGGAALVVLAGLVAVAGLSLGTIYPPATATPEPSPTLRPSPTSSPTPSPTATPTSTATRRPSPPVFSDLTIALGMLSPTRPFLVGDEFDWNTRAVYAVFDYRGMRDGLAWSAIWSRDGEEVARESHLWDVEGDGVSGTRWVAYFAPEGVVLPGGDYAVGLYLDEELQAEASFSIRYYVPPTP